MPAHTASGGGKLFLRGGEGGGIGSGGNGFGCRGSRFLSLLLAAEGGDEREEYEHESILLHDAFLSLRMVACERRFAYGLTLKSTGGCAVCQDVFRARGALREGACDIERILLFSRQTNSHPIYVSESPVFHFFSTWISACGCTISIFFSHGMCREFSSSLHICREDMVNIGIRFSWGFMPVFPR